MKRFIILAMAVLPLLTACKEERQSEGEKYKIFTVEPIDQTLTSNYTATLRGRQFVEVRPQVSGIITEIRIDEGDVVHKGQTLFIIDQVPYKAALETAVANVRSAEAKLATAQLSAESKEALFKEQVVSEFDLQTAKNDLAEAQAALALAKAQEINARNDLSYTEVKSPVDGVASMIPYRVGALVNSSIAEPLVTVSDDSEVYAYISMSENQILDLLQQYGSLQKAKELMPEVELLLSNGKPYAQRGKIDAISGTVDEGTGAVSLRATFPNPDGLLRNGGSGSVVVPTVYKNSLVIPQSATYELQNRIFVWKVVDGKTKSAPVTVYKYNDGQNYIVLSGLTAGDMIVAEGAGLLREGIAVDIEQSTTQPNDSAL
ncbi:MAG TPA: efflux RND transporter periplasmic adaptor subunit [Candidatus Barnesiella excrementigallinarum]|nr:efflux RND transporter periplasmic adaptor subunit [Candidatus Barnesiella excrementigallinarum]